MLPVIEAVLKNNAGSLGSDFFSFTKRLYVRDWTTHVDEINNIPAIVPVAAYSSYPVTSSASPAPSVTLPHYAFAYFTFIPSATAPQDLVLTLSKDAGITTVAFKKGTDGLITEYPLNQSTGTITISGFNTPGTAKVALLISNNSAQDGQTANFRTDVPSLRHLRTAAIVVAAAALSPRLPTAATSIPRSLSCKSFGTGAS